MSEVRTKRMGGRAARKAMRAAPKTEEEKPVLPGMLGGRYRPLSDADIERIHRAALDVLENIGLSDAIPSCIDLCLLARSYFVLVNYRPWGWGSNSVVGLVPFAD